jgi:hypothetical protein
MPAAKLLDARQEAKLNMYQVVQGHCADNSAIVDTNTGFKTGVTDFGGVVSQIDSGAQLVSPNLTGIAIDKNVSKKDLSREAATMAGRIYAFASKNGNNTLKQQADLAESDFLRLKDAELAPACQAIHDLAETNKVALKDYGVTDEKLAALQTKIDAYAAAVPKPRSAIAGRKTTKANIRQLFKQADAVLIDQMDRLVNDFAADHPEFVAGYFNARIIVDPKSKPKENGEGDKNAKGGEADGGGDNDGNVNP